MRQARLYVPTEVVRGLVDGFLASAKGRNGKYCGSFDAMAMRATFSGLPEPVTGFVDYGVAVRALDGHACPKLSGLCNTWTPWMMARLNDAKRTVTGSET